MNPDEQRQKVIARGVTEGILKAVGILALLGLVAGMIIAIGNADFSSGTVSSRGQPVVVLVVNETSDSLLFTWRSDTVSGRNVIPPTKGSICQRFYAHAATGKTYRAAFEIRDPRTGQKDSSGWFQVGYPVTPAWVDTVRAARHHGLRVVHDLNVLASNNCSAY